MVGTNGDVSPHHGIHAIRIVMRFARSSLRTDRAPQGDVGGSLKMLTA